MEGKQYIFEDLEVLSALCRVAGKVNVHAAPAELTTEVTEG